MAFRFPPAWFDFRADSGGEGLDQAGGNRNAISLAQGPIRRLKPGAGRRNRVSRKHTSGLAILAGPLARINLSAQSEPSSQNGLEQINLPNGLQHEFPSPP